MNVKFISAAVATGVNFHRFRTSKFFG